MPKVRNITDQDLWVPILQRTVKPDEVVDIPDPEPFTYFDETKGEQVTRIPDLDEVWNPTVWAAVGGPAKKKDEA